MPVASGRFSLVAVLLGWFPGARCRVWWSEALQRNRRRKRPRVSTLWLCMGTDLPCDAVVSVFGARCQRCIDCFTPREAP